MAAPHQGSTLHQEAQLPAKGNVALASCCLTIHRMILTSTNCLLSGSVATVRVSHASVQARTR